MSITKTIDWQSLNGKTLKIYVTEPNESVIGIDEETGKSYVLRQEQPAILSFPPFEPPHQRNKRGLFG